MYFTFTPHLGSYHLLGGGGPEGQMVAPPCKIWYLPYTWDVGVPQKNSDWGTYTFYQKKHNFNLSIISGAAGLLTLT